MQDQMTARLQALRQEYETGQKMLADLETRRLDLQQTLLRVSGAIQVLEELLEEETGATPGTEGAAPPEPPNALPSALEADVLDTRVAPSASGSAQ
jgi:hypothetical protein